ncbi:MAG TPA: carboxymuconolactone decarboxylase family protein, partial [Candidatus Udaeobacter sp.]|nr:carboxymuconolactone decarboxylase family protein [Candidatus Udaeobacter sp.]
MNRAHSALIRFAAATAAGELAAADRALEAARSARAPRIEAEETALMLLLHAGYPAALEGVARLAQAWPGRARRRREGGPREWRARGERLGRRVYGPVFPRLIENVRAGHPDLAVWMVEQGYGRVLSRSGLAEGMRELVAVAVLAVGGWERQLVSHLKGAVRLGARRSDIRVAFDAGRRRSRSRAACDRA